MKTLNNRVILSAVLLIIFNSQAFASNYNYFNNFYNYQKKNKKVHVTGVPVTGPNRFCGELLWSFEDQGINPLSFSQVAAYAPGQDRPEELNKDNCTTDQLLASIHDPLLSNIGIVKKPDVRLENIPLRDMPKIPGILQGGTNGSRVFIKKPEQTSINPFPVTLSEPSEAITLGQWTSAKGQLTYRCKNDGTATLTARFNNLIANGVYSIWGIWKTGLPNGATVDLPAPLGGVPNAIVPNKRGRATFKRELAFCPSKETNDGSLLLWITLAYHSDSSLYAGVPDAGDLVAKFTDENGEQFESTLSLLMHHEQIAFPINFTSTLNN